MSSIQLQADKAMYRPGEKIQIEMTLPSSIKGAWRGDWVVMDLEQPVRRGEWTGGEAGEGGSGLPASRDSRDETAASIAAPVRSATEPTTQTLALEPIPEGSGAYGLFVTVRDEAGGEWRGEIAFDVAEHWREAPRYGFLSDFAPGDVDDSDLAFLRRHHINIVQFYDWMYRHDQLVPDAEDEFTEPLGRRISLAVVSRKIRGLEAGGMAAMAYAAVYASLSDYAEAHPEQLLYNNGGEPYKLGDYYHIMDISPDSAWTPHILSEFAKVIDYGFHGLHLDQYGFPKQAIRRVGGREEVVRLRESYPSFIAQTREALPSAGLIFNNVSSYPVHTTANAPQDAMYIEVWDPVATLEQLKENIDRARELSGKQVILAAYLPCFQSGSGVPQQEAEIGATVAMASIFASGGYHLLLGEQGNVLADSYYPNYGQVSEAFAATLTRYYDFIVMYRSLLFDLRLEDISMTFAGGINTEIVFAAEAVRFAPDLTPDSVWNIVKERPGYTVIHLINVRGLDNLTWHAGKSQPPTRTEAIEVKVEQLEDVEGVYWTSPDGETMQAQPLAWDWVPKDAHQGHYLRFVVPRLDYWTMAYIKTRPGVAARVTSRPSAGEH